MAMPADVSSNSNVVRVLAGALRFVQRGEKRILQQQWTTVTRDHAFSTHGSEWRDVPLVDEAVGVSPE